MNRGRKLNPSPNRGRPRTVFPGVPNDQIVTTAIELTVDERRRLLELAEEHGMSKGQLIRRWIAAGEVP